MTLYGSEMYPKPIRPKVFVSYHHDNDQNWYNSFSLSFGTIYNLVYDNSLNREIESADTSYIRQSIRENNITGTSLTIVLCGPESWKRRWIDWEIQMTLNKEHALLGIILPTNLYVIPDRLFDNIQSNYAHLIHWTTDPEILSNAILVTKNKSRFTSNIKNNRPSMKRSIP